MPSYDVTVRITKMYEFNIETENLKTALATGIESATLAEIDGSIEPVTLDVNTKARFVSDDFGDEVVEDADNGNRKEEH